MAYIAFWSLIKATIVALNIYNNCYNGIIYVNPLTLSVTVYDRMSMIEHACTASVTTTVMLRITIIC